MALVPHKIVALNELDEGTKNTIAGAVVSLYDTDGNAVTLFDDESGSNGSTAKQTDSEGVAVVYVTAGEYDESVNGGIQRRVTIGGNWLISYSTTTALENSRPTKTGQRAENRERANAQYTLAPSGYTALPGDITAANGRVWELQIDDEANVLWFGDDLVTALPAAIERCEGICPISVSGYHEISSPININKKASIVGYGAVIKISDDIESGIQMVVISNSVRLSGIAFDCNSDNPAQSGNSQHVNINLDSATDNEIEYIEISDCKFINSNWRGISSYTAGDIKIFRFIGNTLENFTDPSSSPQGAVKISTPRVLSCLVRGNVFFNVTGGCFAVGQLNGSDSSGLITITGNVFDNGGYNTDNTNGVFIGTSENSVVSGNVFKDSRFAMSIIDADNFSASGNSISNMAEYGIEIKNGITSTVSGNSFKNVNSAVRSTGLADNVTITGNTFEGVSSSGSFSIQSGGQVNKNWTITGNTFINSAGIFCPLAENFKISSNTMHSDSESTRILVRGERLYITNNSVYTEVAQIGGSVSVIQFSGSNVNIKGNDVIYSGESQSLGVGIGVDSGSTNSDVFIDSNYVKNFNVGIKTNIGAVTNSNVNIKTNNDFVDCNTNQQP